MKGRSRGASPPWVCLRHVEFEGPGLFGVVARERGIELRTVATDLGERVPDVADVGGVIALGGPFSVLDAKQRPHLGQERSLLAGAAKAGLPVMAICLGAQLLASGLGAEVRRAPEPEMGMQEVTLTRDALEDPVLGPEAPTLRIFQLHNDMFDKPDATTRLACSPACPQQGFRLGERAYGLQFHIELPGPLAEYVPASIRPTREERATLAALGTRIIERFFDLAAG